MFLGDLTTPKALRDLFTAVFKDFELLEIAINTVEMVMKKCMTKISEEEAFEKMVRLNYDPTVSLYIKPQI